MVPLLYDFFDFADTLPFMNTDTIESLLSEAKKYINQGDLAEAESIAQQVLAADVAVPEYSARAHIIVARSYRETGRFEGAVYHARKAVEVAESASNTRVLVKAKAELATSLNSLGDYPAALSEATSMLALAQQARDQKAEASARRVLGGIYYNTGDCVRSLESSVECLSILEGMGVGETSKRDFYLIFSGIGKAYQYLGDNSQALEYFVRSNELAEPVGAQNEIMINLTDIGIVYRNLKNFPKALEYMSRAKEIAQHLGAKSTYARNVGNMGVVLNDEGKHHEALTYLEEALTISQEIGDHRPMGYWMHTIAVVYNKLGMLDRAYDGYVQTLHHRRNIPGSKDGIASTLQGLGSLLIEQGKIEEALAYLREAVELGIESGHKSTTASAHSSISYALFKQGNLAEAFEHYRKFHDTTMEMFNDESRRKIEALSIKVAIGEKVKERDIEKMKREQVEKELSSTTMHLAMQTELLGNFRNDLRQIVREIDEPISALKKIKEKLKELPCEQIDWVKFEKQFTEVHPEFKAKIIEKYPDLTKQEVKMCQLARLGLKNIEIAQLLCLSERSVESHRFNLRKKLGLKTEVNLTQFLSGLK